MKCLWRKKKYIFNIFTLTVHRNPKQLTPGVPPDGICNPLEIDI